MIPFTPLQLPPQMPSYAERFAEAHKAFSENYEDSFQTLLTQIKEATQEWRQHILNASDTILFSTRTALSVTYQDKHFEAELALGKIIAVYKTVLAQCQPPSLDKTTMGELCKMGISTDGIQERYTLLFKTTLEQLQNSLAEIEKLKTDLQNAWKDFDAAFTSSNAAMNETSTFGVLFGLSEPFAEAARRKYRQEHPKPT